MRTFDSAARLRRLCCVALSYTMLVSLLTVSPTRATTRPSIGNTAKTKGIVRPAITTAPWQKLSRREGELLVRFRGGVSERAKDDLVAAMGARRKSKSRGESGFEKLELRQGQDASDAAAELSRDPSVELAEPNFLVTRDDVTPNDARFSEQWALRDRKSVV